MTMDSDIICNSNASSTLFQDLVHLLLEDVLRTDKAQQKMQEMVSSKGTVEGFE